jgi:chorismate mutase-like protein
MKDRNNSLETLRSNIDELDLKLLYLLGKRLSISVEIGHLKSADSMPLHDLEREREIISSRQLDAKKVGVPPEYAADLFRTVLEHSRAVAKSKIASSC